MDVPSQVLGQEVVLLFGVGALRCRDVLVRSVVHPGVLSAGLHRQGAMRFGAVELLVQEVRQLLPAGAELVAEEGVPEDVVNGAEHVVVGERVPADDDAGRLCHQVVRREIPTDEEPDVLVLLYVLAHLGRGGVGLPVLEPGLQGVAFGLELLELRLRLLGEHVVSGLHLRVRRVVGEGCVHGGYVLRDLGAHLAVGHRAQRTLGEPLGGGQERRVHRRGDGLGGLRHGFLGLEGLHRSRHLLHTALGGDDEALQFHPPGEDVVHDLTHRRIGLFPGAEVEDLLDEGHDLVLQVGEELYDPGLLGLVGDVRELLVRQVLAELPREPLVLLNVGGRILGEERHKALALGSAFLPGGLIGIPDRLCRVVGKAHMHGMAILVRQSQDRGTRVLRGGVLQGDQGHQVPVVRRRGDVDPRAVHLVDEAQHHVVADSRGQFAHQEGAGVVYLLVDAALHPGQLQDVQYTGAARVIGVEGARAGGLRPVELVDDVLRGGVVGFEAKALSPESAGRLTLRTVGTEGRQGLVRVVRKEERRFSGFGRTESCDVPVLLEDGLWILEYERGQFATLGLHFLGSGHVETSGLFEQAGFQLLRDIFATDVGLPGLQELVRSAHLRRVAQVVGLHLSLQVAKMLELRPLAGAFGEGEVLGGLFREHKGDTDLTAVLLYGPRRFLYGHPQLLQPRTWTSVTFYRRPPEVIRDVQLYTTIPVSRYDEFILQTLVERHVARVYFTVEQVRKERSPTRLSQNFVYVLAGTVRISIKCAEQRIASIPRFKPTFQARFLHDILHTRVDFCAVLQDLRPEVFVHVLLRLRLRPHPRPVFVRHALGGFLHILGLHIREAHVVQETRVGVPHLPRRLAVLVQLFR